jgi:hypothetical protein
VTEPKPLLAVTSAQPLSDDGGVFFIIHVKDEKKREEERKKEGEFWKKIKCEGAKKAGKKAGK